MTAQAAVAKAHEIDAVLDGEVGLPLDRRQIAAIQQLRIDVGIGEAGGQVEVVARFAHMSFGGAGADKPCPRRRVEIGVGGQAFHLNRDELGKIHRQAGAGAQIVPVETEGAATGNGYLRRAVEFGDDPERVVDLRQRAECRGRGRDLLRRVFKADAVAVNADAEREAAGHQIGAIAGDAVAVEPGDRLRRQLFKLARDIEPAGAVAAEQHKNENAEPDDPVAVLGLSLVGWLTFGGSISWPCQPQNGFSRFGIMV